MPKLLLILGLIYCSIANLSAQNIENNGTCNDPIVGAGTYINSANTAGINLLGGASAAENVIDGNLSNFASLQLGVALIGGGSALSVRDSTQIYPAGNRVGFVVQTQGGLLSANVLGGVTINLYLNGTLVQSGTTTSGGLATAGVANSDDGLQRIGITAISNYDEVQIVVASTVGALSSFNVYYAFEEPIGCATNCDNALTVADGASVATSGISGLCLLCSINSPNNVTSNDTTDFATINMVVGVISTGQITVAAGSTISAGTEVGFAIKPSSGLLDVAALGGITITTLNGTTPVESFQASNALVSADVLSGSGITNLSFKTSSTGSFNRVRITVSQTLAALGALQVYYAFTRTDTDGDGISNCMDKCATGSDLLDNDGDGAPNACDADDDNDGLPDTQELVLGTNPFDGDSDDDGLTDGAEVNGTNPLSAPTNPLLADSDGDGLQDGTEVGLIKPSVYTNPAVFVADADSSTTTNPNDFDTDNDGISDGTEDANHNGRVDAGESDPNNPCDPNSCKIDLELQKTVDKGTAVAGEQLTYTLTLKNKASGTAATGVQVLDLLPSQVTYASHTAFAGTDYDPITGIWDVANVMTDSLDSITLEIVVTVRGNGVINNKAEVVAANEEDIDSAPANGIIGEDDYANTCTSVEVGLCNGDTVNISTKGGFASYQWYRNGAAIVGATDSTFTVSESGTYTVSINGDSTCASGLCCPFVANVGNAGSITINGSSTVCAGNPIDLTTVTTDPVISYLWLKPDGSTDTVTHLSIPVANILHNGDYILTATYASGCIAKDTFTVVVSPIVVSPNIQTVCNNGGTTQSDADDTFAFSVNPGGGTPSGKYTVSGPGFTSLTAQSFGEESPMIEGFVPGAGTFEITITDETTSCSSNAVVTPPATCSTCQKTICIPISVIQIN